MNERIREFSDLASSYAGNYEVGSPMWMNFYNEKLAELIVLRCAELSDLAEDHDLHGSTIIKRHFEVA